jgi:hypothetical protein
VRENKYIVKYKSLCSCLLLFVINYNQVYQLVAHGRWFSPSFPASSTTKTGRHNIAEILLKVALKHQKSKSINMNYFLVSNDFDFNV